MHMFILDSVNLVKEFYKPQYFRSLEWSESSVFKNIKYGGFMVSLLKNYFCFLLLKMRVILGLVSCTKGYLRRINYLTNFRFKHILVIEWGFYTDDYLSDEPFFYHDSNLLGFNTFRIEPLFEYEISHYDLSIPIHKTSISRYIHSAFLKDPKPRVGRKFFFRFSYCLPLELVGFVKSSSSLDDGLKSTPPPPISVNFPILFELLLLKFNICSALFSSSYAHIYEFYSLGFFESILIRFRSILDLLVVITLDKLIGLRKFSIVSCSIFEMEFYFLKLKSFYLIKSIDSNFFLKIINFNKLSYSVRFNYIFGVPIKLAFFLLKCIGFLFMFTSLFFFSSYFGVDSLLSYMLETITTFRFVFLKFLLYFFLFFALLFYFFNFLIFLCKLFRGLHFFLSFLLNAQFKVKYFFQLFVSAFFESFFSNFIGIVSYLVLLLVLNSFSLIFFNVFLLVTSFYLLFNFVYVASNILSKSLFGDASYSILRKELYSQELKVFSPVFFPFLLIVVPFCSFIVYLLLCFCYLLRIYLPSLVSKSLVDNKVGKDTNNKRIKYVWNFSKSTFKSSGFKAIFVDTTGSCNNPYFMGFDYGPKHEKPNIDVIPFSMDFRYTETLKNYSFVECGYFFKFILDRNKNLYELQYNYFNYNDFLKTRRGYQSRTLTKFPNRFLYLLVLFCFFPLWLVMNIPLLVLTFTWRVSFFYLNLYYSNSTLPVQFYTFFKNFIITPYYYFVLKNKDELLYSRFSSLVRKFGVNTDVLAELLLENYYYCRGCFDLIYFYNLYYNNFNLRRTTYTNFG